MFITLYRRGGQKWGGEWLNDLGQRYHARHDIWQNTPEGLVEPEELDFIQEKRGEYSLLQSKMLSDGWILLGASFDNKFGRNSDINWLLKQDSWCIVETPFDSHLTLYTKDPIVQLKHQIGWRSSKVDLLELDAAANENGWVTFEVESSKISEIDDWCDTYCNDIYLISTVYKAPLAGYRTLLFTDPNDAIRFRMTNTNVCRRLL